MPAANIAKYPHILLPLLTIKISDKKAASFIRKHGIYTDNIFAARVFPSQMALDHRSSQWEQVTVLALRALYLWLFANTTYPFVATDGSIAGFPSAPTLIASGINIGAPGKQFHEQLDLFIGTAALVYAGMGRRFQRHFFHAWHNRLRLGMHSVQDIRIQLSL